MPNSSIKSPVKTAAKSTAKTEQTKRVVKTPGTAKTADASHLPPQKKSSPVEHKQSENSTKTPPIAASADPAKQEPKTKAKAPTKKNVKTKSVASTKEKVKKPKTVRGNFTMQENEYAILSDVKKTCLNTGINVKKNALLRISVGLLQGLDMSKIKTLVQNLPEAGTKRPSKAK